MKEYRLTTGETALIDDEDYPRLLDHKWYSHHGYASTCYWVNGIKTNICMSRFIMNAPGHLFVHHRNHNPLDNRRCNLIICTPAQNSQHRIKPNNGKTSKYKGVYLEHKRQVWCAYITVNKRRITIGRYPTETEAALAYNHTAITLCGEFAAINVLVPE